MGTVVDQIRVGDRMYDVRLFEDHPSQLGETAGCAPGRPCCPSRDIGDGSRRGPTGDGDRSREPEDTWVWTGARARPVPAIWAARSARSSDRHRPRGASSHRACPSSFGGQYQQQQQSFTARDRPWPPAASGRLNADTLVYRLRRPRPDGRTEILLSPLEFLERVVDLLAPPRKHRHRYCGVFAPGAKLRRAVTQTAGPAGTMLLALERARAAMGMADATRAAPQGVA